MHLSCTWKRTRDHLAYGLLTVLTAVCQLISTVDCRNVVLDTVHCLSVSHLLKYCVDTICRKEVALSSVILCCNDLAVVADLYETIRR
jgi:hypothetical protein